MDKRPDAIRAFWKDVGLRVETASRLIVASSNAVMRSDREDLSQDTMMDLHVFFERRIKEDPEIGLDALRTEVLAWGAVCLDHNFCDLVRKNRRRAPRLKALGGHSNDSEGYLDFSRKRIATPFERQVALQLIDRMRPTSRSPKVQSILDALDRVVSEEIDALPKDIQLIAGVSSNDMHHFRERVAIPTNEKGE